jgi:hypothetical protein
MFTREQPNIYTILSRSQINIQLCVVLNREQRNISINVILRRKNSCKCNTAEEKMSTSQIEQSLFQAL